MTTKKQEAKRYSLSDFNFRGKHSSGLKMPIKLPSGEDTGEWLNVRGPQCDESLQVSREYNRLLYALEDELKPLEDEAEAKGNFFEYNTAHQDAVKEMNIAYMMEIITGWSMDNEFNNDSLLEFLTGWPEIMDQVYEFHHSLKTDLEAK